MRVEIIGLFLMEGPHPIVPSAKTTYSLANYICNCKFYFICKIKILFFMVGCNILSPPLFDDSDLSVLKVILKKYL